MSDSVKQFKYLAENWGGVLFFIYIVPFEAFK